MRYFRWIQISFAGIIATVVLFCLYASLDVPPQAPQKKYRSPSRNAASSSLRRAATLTNDFSKTVGHHPSTCIPHEQLVFIKTHKTGSTTLQTIVNRYGYFHNLSFVFNKLFIDNGHFYFLPMDGVKSPKSFFLPPLGVREGDYNNYKDYDILAVHVRYNRQALDQFMKKGTKYITIIREPSDQWESAFEHFRFQDAFDNPNSVARDRWIETFLKQPMYYREKLSHLWYEHVLGRRWYYAQNSQTYVLGLDSNSSTVNEQLINTTITRLEQEFDLILLTEYFDESLLILRKQLCWEYEDIVYFPKNLRVSRRTLTEDLRHKIRAWNHADYLLYQHFNATLWREVQKYGPTFQEDLKYFRRLNNQIFQQCGQETVTLTRKGKRVDSHLVFSPKINASLFCRTVAEDKHALFKRIHDRQDPFKIYRAFK